jgi:hypothetical protein
MSDHIIPKLAHINIGSYPIHDAPFIVNMHDTLIFVLEINKSSLQTERSKTHVG